VRESLAVSTGLLPSGEQTSRHSKWLTVGLQRFQLQVAKWVVTADR